MGDVKLEVVPSGSGSSKVNSNFERVQDFLNTIAVLKNPRNVNTGTQFNTRLDMNNFNIRNADGIVRLGDLGPFCTVSADIMLVLDNTGSMRISTYDTVVKPAVNNMIQRLIDIGRDVTMGFMPIRQGVDVITHGLSTDLTLTQEAVEELPEPGFATDLASPIDAARAELTLHGRVGVRGVILMITDGLPSLPDVNAGRINAENSATAAQEDGYRIVVFGLTGQDLSQQSGGGPG